MKLTVGVVFWIAFFVSIFFQGLRLVSNRVEDASIWTTAATTVRTENHTAFPKLDAYMHPGGPVIEGTILTHALVHTSFANSLTVFLVFFDSLCIAILCVLCFVLSNGILWPLTVLGIVSLQPIFAPSSLYTDLTPPSLAVTLLLPILCLYTWYLYGKGNGKKNERANEKANEKGGVKNRLWVAWAVLAGLIAATRVDVGGVMVALFFLFLFLNYDFKKVLLIAVGSFLAFCVFDPFIWFAPITQIHGLISAMLTHYGAPAVAFSFSYYVLNLGRVAMLGLIGMVFGVIFVCFRKQTHSPVPVRFLVFLLVATAFVGGIFLSAQVQAGRYLTPLFLVWIVLLPLFIFNLIAELPFTFISTQRGREYARFLTKLLIIALLICPPAFSLFGEVASHHLIGMIRL